jgi:hypothetical protein
MQITIRFVALFVTNNYLEKALIGCYIKEVLFGNTLQVIKFVMIRNLC